MKLKLLNEYRGLRKEVYVMFIGRMMTNMGSMIWPMFTLIMNQKLGFDASTIAIYMFVISICSMPVSLLGGKLADRYSKRNIIIICDLVSILSYLYCACVKLTMSTIIVFCVASLFQSVEWPSYDALIADFTTSKDRERAYSLSYLGNNLGLVLAPTIGGLLLENHLNLAFLINALSIALSTVLVFFKIRDVHREVDHTEAAVYERDIDANVPVFAFLRGSKLVVLFIITRGLAEVVYSMYTYLMPLDLSAVYGAKGSILFGTMSSVNCIVVVCFTALITRVFSKVRETGKLVISEGLILAGYLVFMFLMKVPAFCYMAIIIFTWGEIFGSLAGSPFMTHRVPASHRGRVLAVSNVFCSLLGAAFEVVAGFMYDGLGSTKTWTMVVVMVGIAMLMYEIIRRLDKKTYPMLYTKEQTGSAAEAE